MKKIIWFFILFILILFPIFQGYNGVKNFSLQHDTPIQISSGDTLYSVGEKLGISPTFFRLYLKIHPQSFVLQKGNYTLHAGEGISHILQELQKPENEDEQITILEGWNIYDIDALLVSKGLIQAGDYIKYTTQCEGFCEQKYKFGFIADTPTLEGFLYPDTYNINPHNFQISTLVTAQLENFQKKVIDSGIIQDMGSIEILDVINLASIVQKEANKKDNPEEIAIVAGILKKRLDEGWMLGADATVCYAHQIATQDCSPDIVLKYLYDKNGYNTRQKTGLPDGAISNPEAEVIDATVHSKSSPYYYYLHDTSGQIHYATTDAEHIQNKNMYLR